VPEQRVTRLGIVGAGTMGAGIGLVALRAGLSVVLQDASDQACSGRRFTCASISRKPASKPLWDG